MSCRSSPTRQWMRGAPKSPSRSRSQPASVSSRQRAAARPGEIGHGGSGDEADVGFLRQAQQLQQPVARSVLDGGDGGRGVAEHRVLVPGADQPVGRHGGRQGTADDPAEKAPGRHGHEPRFGLAGQIIHDVGRGHAGLGQRSAEGRGEFPGRLLRTHPAGRAGFPASAPHAGRLQPRHPSTVPHRLT